MTINKAEDTSSERATPDRPRPRRSSRIATDASVSQAQIQKRAAVEHQPPVRPGHPRVQNSIFSSRINGLPYHHQRFKMKFAIPLAEGKLAIHFGHCASFALIDVDQATKPPRSATTSMRRLMNRGSPLPCSLNAASSTSSPAHGAARPGAVHRSRHRGRLPNVETPRKAGRRLSGRNAIGVGGNACDH